MTGSIIVAVKSFTLLLQLWLSERVVTGSAIVAVTQKHDEVLAFFGDVVLLYKIWVATAITQR